MTYNITLTANHQSLTTKYLPLAAESVQYLTAKVVYETDDWTGREIKAMFEHGHTVYEVSVIDGEITAKQQLNLTAGDWRVWLVGNSARDGEVIPRITTNVAHIIVAPTGSTEGSPFPAIPPTVEERLRADMGNLADLTTEDKSSLVAAINEVRQTGGGSSVQPDWNQNDDTQPDYVKNRPFYTGDPVETVLVEESTVSFAENNGLYMARFPSTFEATVGETYKVSWDGAAYECICTKLGRDLSAIGNLSIAGEGPDTGEPFLMVVYNGQGIAIGTADTSASHTFSICVFAPEVVKIDPKYIRDMYYTGDPVETVLVEESTVTFAENNGLYMAEIRSSFEATVGETYKVSWDGAAYECICVDFNNIPAIGNLSIAGAGSDTGEPFLMTVKNGRRIQIGTADTSASHTISISANVAPIIKIDEKYLPDSIISDINDAQNAANRAQSTANSAQSTANTAYTHSVSTHAPTNAEKNVIVGIKKNGANLSIDSDRNVNITVPTSASDIGSLSATNPTGTGSFSLNRKVSTTIGKYSFAEGQGTTASGDDSHAEGLWTTASDTASHAEGQGTTASGYGSHAEGYSTTASGNRSHAEGDSTTASGDYSHAEGYSTTASGNRSHAEGDSTTASGIYSHAEGRNTTASGTASHAEGSSSNKLPSAITSSSNNSDIITAWTNEKFSLAKGDNSHVEGMNNLALGFVSHAEGQGTTASGDYSHAEGDSTTASGNHSHAEGDSTTASGGHSHAEGWTTTASRTASHAEGYRTTASDTASHAEGRNTTASGTASHAEGQGTKASSVFQHVQGKYNVEDSSGVYAHIVGNGSDSVPSNAHTLDWSGNAWYAGTVEGKALILPSSAADSTKKFRITVDDSGTITATEVS